MSQFVHLWNICLFVLLISVCPLSSILSLPPSRDRQTCGHCGHSGTSCTNKNSEISHFTFWVNWKVIKIGRNNQNSIAVHPIQIVTTNRDSELFNTPNNQLFPHSVQTMILIRVNHMWCHLLTEETYCKNHTMVFDLRVLNSSCNDCIVESEVSRLEDVFISSRHLDDENIKKLNLEVYYSGTITIYNYFITIILITMNSQHSYKHFINFI